MNPPLENMKEHELPEGVEIIRKLDSPDQLKEGDIFSDGKGDKLYRIIEGQFVKFCDSWVYDCDIFDAQTGRFIHEGAIGKRVLPPYNANASLMRVPEGFLYTEEKRLTKRILTGIRLQLTKLCHSLPKV